MPYDPTLPANNSPVSSAELREQLTNLRALLDNKADTVYVDALINEQTAGNVVGYANLELTVSNPPTQAEVQAVVDKLYELMNALKRI
ncbi:MAG: hypothetical protein EXS35_00990 [Pedosphaera sp.]|nr:hypothetical protein [Pedosphaera sp.]